MGHLWRTQKEEAADSTSLTFSTAHTLPVNCCSSLWHLGLGPSSAVPLLSVTKSCNSKCHFSVPETRRRKRMVRTQCGNEQKSPPTDRGTDPSTTEWRRPPSRAESHRVTAPHINQLMLYQNITSTNLTPRDNKPPEASIHNVTKMINKAAAEQHTKPALRFTSENSTGTGEPSGE